MMPISEVEILDTWHTTGLAGSGSDDVAAHDVFVPEERVVDGWERKLPEGFVEDLRKALAENGIASPDQPWFKPGRRVRLLSGPFADYVGTLLKLTAKDRVTLLLRVLGRDVETLVSTRQIAPAA